MGKIKFFKVLSIAMCVAATLVFSLIGWGSATIPDELYVTSDSEIDVSELFTVSIDKASPATVTGSTGEYTLNVSLLNAIPVKSARLTVSQRKYVVPGGSIIGLKLYTRGVVVVGMGEVMTESGSVNPAAQAGIAQGDSIMSIDGTDVSTTLQVAAIFQKNDGTPLTLVVERDGKTFETELTLVLSPADGKYKAGLWIRDSAAGIGTMTYYDRSNGIYASLGHAVCDIDTGEIMTVSDGECVKANITGCYKGNDGSAGELCGVFSGGSLGSLLINGKTGAFGVLDSYDVNSQLMPVATASEVTLGYAQIISTVDSNGPQIYDIEITKLYKSGGEETRNMAIKVTDQRLIELTGGIVQGMSGSPIIQNGMLVGAVTHVFVNDPIQGYAIFAESMTETSDSLAASLFGEAA